MKFKKIDLCVRSILLLCALNLTLFGTYAKTHIEVAETIKFADIELKLTPSVQKQIEKHAEAILENKELIQANLKQLKFYLQVVEDILIEEGLPTDFKYMALLETSLLIGKNNPNSAGFWKLDPKIADEIGLIINEKVDERFNLINSSRGVAQYLRRNNLYFKNWLFSMLSLKLGFEETKAYASANFSRKEITGASTFEINNNSHNIFRNFLVHKLILEKMIGESINLKLKIVQYNHTARKTPQQIAKKFNVSLKELNRYNQWLKIKRVPQGKIFPYLIPPKGFDKSLLIDNVPVVEIEDEAVPEKEEKEVKYDDSLVQENSKSENIVNVSQNTAQENEEQIPEVPENTEGQLVENNIEVEQENDEYFDENPERHIVVPGNTLYSIAKMYNLSITELRLINGLKNTGDKIYPGQVLLLKHSPNKQVSKIENNTDNQIHIVKQGETIKSIAAQYNLSLFKIKSWNNLNLEDALMIGQKLIVGKAENQNTLKTANPADSKSFQQKIQQGRTINRLLVPTNKDKFQRGSVILSDSLKKNQNLLINPRKKD
jgi:membrane-bound lytic murein transglycosylase D